MGIMILTYISYKLIISVGRKPEVGLRRLLHSSFHGRVHRSPAGAWGVQRGQHVKPQTLYTLVSRGNVEINTAVKMEICKGYTLELLAKEKGK